MENFIFGEVHESVKSAKAECPLEGLHNLMTPSLADLNFTIQIVASNEYSNWFTFTDKNWDALT